MEEKWGKTGQLVLSFDLLGLLELFRFSDLHSSCQNPELNGFPGFEERCRFNFSLWSAQLLSSMNVLNET